MFTRKQNAESFFDKVNAKYQDKKLYNLAPKKAMDDYLNLLEEIANKRNYNEGDKIEAEDLERIVSSVKFCARIRALKRGPPRYTASAPASIAARRACGVPAGANSSGSFVISGFFVKVNHIGERYGCALILGSVKQRCAARGACAARHRA